MSVDETQQSVKVKLTTVSLMGMTIPDLGWSLSR